MSQPEFARALGLHLRTVAGIEAGEHRPSYMSQRRLRELVERHKQNRRRRR